MATNSVDKAIVGHILKDTGDLQCGLYNSLYPFQDSSTKSLREIVTSAAFNNPLFLLKFNANIRRDNVTPRITYFSSDRDVKRRKGKCEFNIYVEDEKQDHVDEVGQRIAFLLLEPYRQRASISKITSSGAIIGAVKLLEETDAQSETGNLFLKRLKFEILFIEK